MIEFLLELFLKSSLLLLIPIVICQVRTLTSADVRSKISVAVLCTTALLPLPM